ncbi:MAG: hypothetical protein JWN40_5954 [Phycisphaerales bacterium]|nr:hypothetical protein [Phycisphaerales bacterium]
MKRAALILFHMAAALSLVLFLAAIGAWWWGRSAELEVMRRTQQSSHFLTVSRGELRLVAFHRLNLLPPRPPRMLGWTCDVSSAFDPRADARGLFPKARPPVAGFFFGRLKTEDDDLTWILLPMAFVVPVFAILPLAAGARRVRRRRRAWRLQGGRCIACGYDLRSSPVRCPECGHASSQPAAASA